MNNWNYEHMTQEGYAQQTQAQQFEQLQLKYLQLKYDTNNLQHHYKAIAQVTRALYMHTSVLLSVNIVVAIEEIQLCVSLMRTNVYYDYLLPVYETALQELELIKRDNHE